ncbi:hypothetical protein CBP51_12130 [Cellvibrio mixtus]|uniref:Uncharacterized protein n=1 Tax=Cellvibrio mixtus TaxID=39650 RepID=A0A266QCP1_9GAMM|nr:hypothetical protein [Cellvibrio mixtus]OZY87674.1 hypothetical protein CBP51_12130 [Cellvibrio mixtus]
MTEKNQQFTTPSLDYRQEDQDTLAFGTLSKELEDCQDQIKALNTELDQRFTEIATLTRLLLEKEDYSDQLLNDINHKNEQINQLSSEVTNLAAQLAEADKLTDSIEFKNIHDNDLSSKIKFLQNASSNFNATLNDKNQQIEALQRLRDTLTTTLELKNQAHDDLLNQLAMKDVNIESLCLHLGQVEGDLTSRDAEITHFKNELHAIYDSTSWRATAPLRYVKKLLGLTKQ